ncbi:MAG: pantetheine-phosphate adenylyltransferase [Chloroflexota bacterium]
MNNKIALVTGTFNPFTKGHKHVVDMGLLVFDSVVVGIGYNPAKAKSAQLFTIEQRIRMASASLVEHSDRVLVKEFTGATVDFAEEVNATAILRGIRNDMDSAHESSMSHANSLMAELEIGRTIPTFYVPCPPSLIEISSTRVRELIELRRSIEVLRHYVLPAVANVIEEEIYNQ